LHPHPKNLQKSTAGSHNLSVDKHPFAVHALHINGQTCGKNTVQTWLSIEINIILKTKKTSKTFIFYFTKNYFKINQL